MGRRAEQNRKRSVFCEVRGLEPKPSGMSAYGINPRTSQKTLRLRFCPARQALAGILLLLLLAACGSPVPARKVIILGLDGLDPLVTKQLMADGKLPSFSRLARSGGFTKLGTSTPPESPVAWSNFITGLDPGGHGIFDFIHRDPKTLKPYLSSTTTEEPGWRLPLGQWELPIWPGKVRLNRAGRAFWEMLEENEVPCTVIRIPANYPPTDCPARQLSGMGTPDLEGTYGTFSFYTDEPEGSYGEISGGRVNYVRVIGDRVDAELPGPPNGFRRDRAQVAIPFEVFIDSEHPVAKIAIQNRQVLLKTGEWSPWTPVTFPVLPVGASVDGMVRFHLKQVRPDFKLYVSPVNIDPSRPVLPISEPSGYARELADRVGLFSTLGIAEDTKAVTSRVLSSEDFLQQWQLLHDEELKLLDDQLRSFRSGLLFFYSGRADQLQHMFWRSPEGGPGSAGVSPALGSGVSRPGDSARTSPGVEIERAYRAMDRLVQRVLEAAGPDTLVIALSDHGFADFRRAFSLNNWLLENGFAARKQSSGSGGYLEAFDWGRTQAYGLGFSGLYLNLRGREKGGTVSAAEKEALLSQLSTELVQFRDPSDNGQVITRVLRGDRIYSGALARNAPDLVVCYNRGYRASWETVVGLFADQVIADNTDQWSGDHLMDPEVVPGVLFSNRPISASDPSLLDLAPTILKEFGVEKPREMKGQPIF